MNPVDGRPRVAFVHAAQPEWSAGAYYLRNVLSALRALDEEARPQIALATGSPIDSDSVSLLRSLSDSVIQLEPQTGWTASLVHYGAILARRHRSLSVESSVSRTLRRARVDAAWLPGGEPGMHLPWMGWIPDFQHIHLPEMFSAATRRGRSEQFAMVARDARAVVLSSRDAWRDFHRLFPAHASKAHIVSFVAQTHPDVYEGSPAWVCEKYHLPKRFIYLPNQFWKHKNHRMVIEALTLARASHPELTVVCTGNTNDYRFPLYFGELLTSIAEGGHREHMIMLGLVPHDHVHALMRQSLVVLQPSLFEGWSTTVEEARSLGKALLLSDIAVHREQAPPESTFFPLREPEALARRLVEAWDSRMAGPDLSLEAAAREALPERTRRFGQAYAAAVSETLD